MAIFISINKIKEEIFINNISEKIKVKTKNLKFSITTDFQYFPQKEELLLKLGINYLYKENEKEAYKEIMKFVTSNSFKLKGLNEELKKKFKGKEEEFKVFLESNNEGDSVNLKVPPHIFHQIVGISYSTMRGMLVYKLSGTPMENLYLPMVSPSKFLADKKEKVE